MGVCYVFLLVKILYLSDENLNIIWKRVVIVVTMFIPSYYFSFIAYNCSFTSLIIILVLLLIIAVLLVLLFIYFCLFFVFVYCILQK
jgi:hypothetical protein